jgi:PEP-CTERM motif
LERDFGSVDYPYYLKGEFLKMKKYFVLILICFVILLIQGNVFASTIESDMSATYGSAGFADTNAYTLGQSFYVNTPFAVNTLESITTWIGTEYDDTIFSFNIYAASDTTTSLFNTQLTLGYESASQQVAITGINLSLDNLTDYIFTYTLVNPDPPYFFASIASSPMSPGPDVYEPGEYLYGSSSGALYGFPYFPLDLKFQAELSHESAPVPEPATIFLLGLGILGLTGINRKKIS